MKAGETRREGGRKCGGTCLWGLAPQMAEAGKTTENRPLHRQNWVRIRRVTPPRKSANKTHCFDTRRLFVVAAGAFEGIDRIVERRLQERAGFGFGTSGTLREIAPERLVAEHMTPDDLVRYGLCEEFVGRFSVVCTLDPLDAGDLREILLQARGSPLAEAKAYYALHGIDLEFDDAAIDAIVARATSQRTGARALRRLMHAVLADVECQLPELAAAGIGAVSVALVDGELRVRCLEAGRRAVGVTRAEQLRAERRLARGAGAPARPEAAPFTDTRGWSDERICAQLEVVKIGLGWGATTGAARRWWEAFEDENRHQFGLVLRLAQELAAREATISEFFISYVFSNTDNIQAIIHYLDYSRLKKEEERRKKEKAAGEARHRSGDTCPPGGAPTPSRPTSTGERHPRRRSQTGRSASDRARCSPCCGPAGTPARGSAGGLTGHEGAFVIGGRSGADRLHPQHSGGSKR